MGRKGKLQEGNEKAASLTVKMPQSLADWFYKQLPMDDYPISAFLRRILLNFARANGYVEPQQKD